MSSCIVKLNQKNSQTNFSRTYHPPRVDLVRNKNAKIMFPPGIEPRTICVLGRCDNHYTTETQIHNVLIFFIKIQWPFFKMLSLQHIYSDRLRPWHRQSDMTQLSNGQLEMLKILPFYDRNGKKVTITFSCNILMILKIHQTFFKKLIKSRSCNYYNSVKM